MSSTMQIDRLLETTVRRNASDLHLAVGKPPTLRMHGHLRELQTKVLEPEDTMALMKAITPERIQQEFEETGSGDFGFAYGEEARFRVAIFKQKGYASLVLRRIPNTILTFEQIGLPDMARQICRRPRGIFLVTGPTGSGKSTTLASMVDYINNNFDRHIITMEDPIEYYHNHKKSIVVQREVGVDVPNFSEAIRRALRQDPDVMMVGEMRDLATIGAAVTAAETGHMVDKLQKHGVMVGKDVDEALLAEAEDAGGGPGSPGTPPGPSAGVQNSAEKAAAAAAARARMQALGKSK